ncbi:hypothetical protein GQ457_12G024690 [Hibiscus cannabinus]
MADHQASTAGFRSDMLMSCHHHNKRPTAENRQLTGLEITHLTLERKPIPHERLIKEATVGLGVEKKISKMRNAMYEKMSNLHNKTYDIEKMTGTSFKNQRELLDKQCVVLDGLQSIIEFQLRVLDESRDIEVQWKLFS